MGTGERAFLNRLEGSCHVPIAALGKVERKQFTLDGLVADVDGKVVIRESHSGPVSDAENIGIALADHLLSLGAENILAHLREEGKANEG